MSANLSTITRACEPKAVKGLEAYIQVANIAEVATIPAATAKVISTDITFTLTKGFHKWDTSVVLSKNTFKVENTGDPDNPAYRTTVVVFIAGLTAERSHILESMAGCGALVITDDKASQKRLVGDLNTPAMISFEENNNGDANGYTVTIVWESGYTPHFYTGTVTAGA